MKITFKAIVIIKKYEANKYNENVTSTKKWLTTHFITIQVQFITITIIFKAI